MLMLIILFTALGILSILIALPLWFEMIKPNPVYGFRVRATLENEKVWYAVNKYFGGHLAVVGILQVITALGLSTLSGLSEDAYALLVAGVFAVSFTVVMNRSFRFLRSL